MINDNRHNANTPGQDSPTVLLFCTDLMFGVRLQNMARAAGFRPITLRSGAPLPPGEMLVVDLSARGDWEAAIRQAAERNVEVVAFGPHMDAGARRRARQAGASRVLANSNLTRDLPTIFATQSSRFQVHTSTSNDQP